MSPNIFDIETFSIMFEDFFFGIFLLFQTQCLWASVLSLDSEAHNTDFASVFWSLKY